MYANAMTRHAEPRPVRRHAASMCALALIAALFVPACEGDLAPQFEITGTGSVEGLVFFDVAEDGVFDPASGDVPIAGVGVAVQDRGTGNTYPGGTATSGSNGRFQVTGLPAGTHDLLIDTLTVPAGVSICQNPLQVTVNLNETRFSQVRGRAGCLITIQAAKELAEGEFAIVRGIVTSSPGQIEVGWTYIQDQTAGARVFGGLDGLGIQIGDQVEVGAVTGQFTNDFEFGSVVFRARVEGVGALTPKSVTTAEVAASGTTWTDPLQGLLITIAKAKLTAAFGAGGANIQNGIIDDGSGAITIRIDDGVADRNTLNNLMTVGKCYDITGFGANFAGAGQIFPRSVADIVEVPCT
jgi:DNA/RNA endonuclease YhcR with UshA esterase domain